MAFVHLHVHTRYSLLSSTARIKLLAEKAGEDGQPALAITDRGNMFGVPEFVLACNKHGVKPIIGCEWYVASEDYTKPSSKTHNQTYRIVAIAMNATGYGNLCKLSQIAYKEGFYRVPRIEKRHLEDYREGLVYIDCSVQSEARARFKNNRLDDSRALLTWYRDTFGEQYFVGVQRHGAVADETAWNEQLIEWIYELNLQPVATNDVLYVDQSEAEAHDLLLALSQSRDFDDVKRFRILDDSGELNTQYYFKSSAEMRTQFSDLPAAIDNTLKIAQAVDFELDLSGKMMMPQFAIPEGFADDNAFLRHLTLEGAKDKYGEMVDELLERIDRELDIIAQMGYASYFLIVQEFTTVARDRGVYVGPGRGSAAGSVVAYCTGIIDVDPLEYDLFFERFLNPERVSPPDIDIDFDDDGRGEVIRFVVEKYGEDSVAQIITYGTMGAKTAIRDVGRVLRIPLEDVNRIAKLIPDRPGMNFKKALDKGTNPDTWEELEHAFTDADPDVAKMMQFARLLEGTPRHTGIHAAGVIIAPGRLTDYAPIAVARSKDGIVTTQYEGPMAEQAGLLKMDFLGLKTLSIIKTAIQLVKAGHGIEIDPDNIPLDDEKTYALYQRGETVATFQFESEGMRKYLKQLKPTVIEDLIAMNALYRPGPMDNIPSFIARKHGKETIEYPHPLLEPILKNTYGIMVYQEQIMAAARTLAGYTLGGADLLRRAMGKKKVEVMEKERAKFVEGAAEKDIDQKKAEEIFALMEKFAGYGFNKSHAAAYSILAFRTGYLKANYPAEYMAAVLSHNLDNLDKITLFIDECRRMGIDVLSPSVNESQYLFSVNKQGQIRFGLGAIKGVGQSVAEAIIAEREAEGLFESIFDLTERVDYNFLNKKAFESLCYAGALDCFETPRSVYFQVEGNNGEARHLLEMAVMYGARYQEEQNSNQMSIFGGGGDSTTVSRPKIPKQEQQWSLIQQLNHERDVIGFYLSAHPLDRYKHAIAAFARTPLDKLEDHQGRDVSIAAIVTSARERRTQSGNRFGSFTIEDKTGKTEFALFRDDYAKYKSFLEVNECVLIKGKYATRFNGSEYELKIIEVRLLDGLVEDQVKRLTLQIPLQVINTGFINTLDKLLVNHKGKCGVRTQIFDANQQLEIALRLGNRAVHPSAELLTAIEAMNVRCRLH